MTGTTYKFNINSLGNLGCIYDSLGRRTLINGSFARTGLPGAMSSATHDAANELTNWNATPISYDLNGNMLSDGTNAFTWNARNQVATLNNVSLQYDAGGRRTKNIVGTSFLYDGANATQELFGSTVTANLLSGGVDEVFTRTDGSGASTPLKDGLGSTIALVDSSGDVQTSYSYDPFGATSFSGAANANEFQYTGRENEGNGLYFYRARFYSPQLGRFISQDPTGFAGGINLYAYVGDGPTNALDPFGTDCKTMWYLITWCSDPADASDTFKKAERVHEQRHRDDFWNGNRFTMSCGELEYRGFQAEIPVWKKRIDDLSGRYSSLTANERRELQEDKSVLGNVQSQTVDFLEAIYCGHDRAWRQRQEDNRHANQVIDEWGISLK